MSQAATPAATTAAPKNVVILISGRGSNMEAMLRARDSGLLPADKVRFAAVLSNRPDAKGLATAAAAGIATAVVDHKAYPDRASFDTAMMAAIDAYQPDLVVLAGFMRILTPAFVAHYEGRLLNIHPSLLPALPGLHTHQKAIDAGLRVHGCTVHFVTADLDHGPVVIQAAVPVLQGDDEDTLAARVLAEEHKIYPQAVRWFVDGRLRLDAGRVHLIEAVAPRAALLSPALD
jgi:phosphoribosylglycinamide formyltransferase-1